MLSELEKASQGKVTGLILPPPDVRAVVDKTAAFVAKHGKSFEEKILGSAEGRTPKFNFMRPQDPYHAYYEFKIRCGQPSGHAPSSSQRARGCRQREGTTPAPAAGELSEGSVRGSSTAAPGLRGLCTSLCAQPDSTDPRGGRRLAP